MTLSDIQTLILTAAAQHPDGIATPPASLPPAPRAAVAKAMLRAGLLAPTGAEHADPSLAWKLDGALLVLRLTEAGLGAISVESQRMQAPLGNAVLKVPEAPSAASFDDAATSMPADCDSKSLAAWGAEWVRSVSQPAEAAQGASQAPHGPSTRLNLRGAARAVLVAWDAPDRPDLAVALDALRAALPARAAAPRSTAPRQLRTDTKQAQVLALLRRPEGASGPALIEATGWAPHTVRGFLAGLARKGITVTVLERVRQVGPNKAGAKGSYSVYRIADAG